MTNVLILLSLVVFITAGFSFYAWFSNRFKEKEWNKDFAVYRKDLVAYAEDQFANHIRMIDEKTRRPPKEWTLADFQQLMDESPNKFHIRFIMQDGTKVELDRNGFALPGERDLKKDPYEE
jgi:hypothetical protein